MLQPPFTGHEFRSQDLCSTIGPVHGSPPFLGGGLSQALVLVFVLAPQVTPHDVQLLHNDQFPGTISQRPQNFLQTSFA